MDHRIAAEILLLFAEDITGTGTGDKCPPADRRAGGVPKEPVAPNTSAAGEGTPPARVPMQVRGRLSDDDEPLDRTLARLGVSPHPGAVLLVEGEVEEWTVPKVLDQLGLSRDADVVSVVCMRGAEKQLPLVATALAAPILGSRHGNAYAMVRPPTHLVLAIDPDGPQWPTPERVERTRLGMVAAITAAARAQQPDLETSPLVSL